MTKDGLLVDTKDGHIRMEKTPGEKYRITERGKPVYEGEKIAATYHKFRALCEENAYKVPEDFNFYKTENAQQ